MCFTGDLANHQLLILSGIPPFQLRHDNSVTGTKQVIISNSKVKVKIHVIVFTLKPTAIYCLALFNSGDYKL